MHVSLHFPARCLFIMLVLSSMTQTVSLIWAQNYPQKPVRIIATEIGGTGDVVARIIARGLAPLLGQPLVVENRTAVVAAQTGAAATPDGYTLVLAGNGSWIAPLIQKTQYDMLRDFATVSQVSSSPLVLVVNPTLPVKSVKELIALAAAKPGTLNFAVAPTGSANHLAAELFKSMVGINIVGVPYKGAGPALTALIAGEVQLMFPPAGAAMSQVNAGRVRALAVTSALPSPLCVGLPTIAASGLPGYEASNINGMFVPAGTSAIIIEELDQNISEVLTNPDVREKFFRTGFEAVASSPAEFAAAIKADISRLGKVIKDAGIRVDGAAN